MSKSLQFDDSITCIAMIAGRRLKAPDGRKIENIIKNAVKNEPKTTGFFHGNSCGKYDHIIEFKNPTAKIARYILNQIRAELSSKLPKTRRISTSVFLGSEIGLGSDSLSHIDYEKPIRTYTLLRSDRNRLPEMAELAEKLNRGSESGQNNLTLKLVWTDSVFVLLIISACSLWKALRMAKSFIASLGAVECSTIAALRYGKEDVIDNSFIDLHGLVFAKLRNLSPLLISHQNDFLPMAANLGVQPLRLGDYDRCLFTKKPNLADVIEATRQLKKDNPRKLLNTSTILFTGD